MGEESSSTAFMKKTLLIIGIIVLVAGITAAVFYKPSTQSDEDVSECRQAMPINQDDAANPF